MYKKLVELRSTHANESRQLEAEVNELQSILEKPEPPPFDEFYAVGRVTSAKSNDYLENTKTSAKVTKDVDKDREDSLKALADFTEQKSTAQQRLNSKLTQRASIHSEITALDWKIKALVVDEAKARRLHKIQDYHLAAVNLLTALIEIDALNAVIAENPEESPAKQVLRIDSLPALDAGMTSFEPWQVQASGEKLIFTRESALAAVHAKRLTLTTEIEGELYAR